MTTNRMLIDASHPEETRVVVQRGNRIDEFDYESASRKQLRGNIYLAKVTRVEPSLQAAFIEYGGNRHGFLAFSEIHPDYYQIPVADRQALLEEEARFAEHEEEEPAESERSGGRRGRRRRGPAKARTATDGEAISENAEEALEGDVPEPDETTETLEAEGTEPATAEDAERAEDQANVEQIGGSDALEDMREQRRSFRPRKQYKIQEVIKRRQILLVQVVKEERGNKGAALTTYLSLAGRYCVLMPNTARGGGISRKITNSADRKRLKELAGDLEVPDGMGVILRTAGASRTKPEIKRDFEYLIRVWEQVRETTLQSVAPMLVHEEGSLIKRSLRDLYGKEVDEVIVSGEGGYKEARDFMKMLMPSHLKSVKAHREAQPLFARHGVESQLDAMFGNNVTLKSGGYIVINPTEALVSIDVNSGRSTREHNIEDTALKTNIEAAEEVARQLRLRDLAGLIVIDFIDMEENRNNRTVEKKLKDCLKSDRARIQVGRISPFGLMEMSRQRMRTGVLESSTIVCMHCGGSGFVRATSSIALMILRGMEEALLKNAQFHLNVKTRTEVALYILNQKRLTLRAIEERFGITIMLLADDSLHGTNYFTLERGEPAPEGGLRTGDIAPVVEEADDDIEVEDFAEEIEEATQSTSDEPRDEPRGDNRGGERDDENGPRGRRRRRRGRGRDREFRDERPVSQKAGESTESGSENIEDDQEGELEPRPVQSNTEEAAGERDGRRRRRRGRRGGRNNRPDGEGFNREVRAEVAATDDNAAMAVVEEPMAEMISAPEAFAEPAPKKRGRAKKVEAETVKPEAAPELARDTPVVEAEPKPKASRGRAKKSVESEAVTEPVVARVVAKPAPEPEIEDANRPKRTGWWAKAKKAMGGE